MALEQEVQKAAILPVLGPFAAYLGTAAKLFGLVSKIYEWGERAVGRAHTSEEQRAAYVLRNAGMLLAAIRTLDNQVHSTIGALRTFNPKWTDPGGSTMRCRRGAAWSRPWSARSA